MSAASATFNARRAADSKGMDRLARLGLVSRAVIYLVIGVLAVLMAFGKKQGETDQRGAVQQLDQQTGGFVLVLIVAIGLACYAVWRLSEAAFGVAGEGDKAGPRAQSLIRGLVYAFLAVSAFTILVQGRETEPGEAAAVVHRAIHALHRRTMAGRAARRRHSRRRRQCSSTRASHASSRSTSSSAR